MILTIVKDVLVEYSFVFILGAVFGSFLNVLIVRLPLNISVVYPSSKTLCCKRKIKFYHNIPILSYLFLKGKCAYCKARYSFVYFFVELFSACLALYIIVIYGLSLNSVFLLLLFYTLLVLSFIDLKYKAVPDYLLIIVLLLSLFVKSDNLIEAFKNAFLFAGAISLLLVFLNFYIQNIKAKFLKKEELKTQEALGEGDIVIFAIIGIILGVKAGLFAIFLASIFAILPALYLHIKCKEYQTPFIPFLFLGLICEFVFNISKVF